MAKYRCKVIKMVLKSLFLKTLDKNMHIATSQLVYIEMQFTGFYVIHASINGFFLKRLCNSCSSLDAFRPQFRDGLCVLILCASLKSKMLQLFALSITTALFLIWQILNLFKLKELLSALTVKYFICTDDEFAINSRILHIINPILFIYLNIRLKIRWIYSDYIFYCLFTLPMPKIQATEIHCASAQVWLWMKWICY